MNAYIVVGILVFLAVLTENWRLSARQRFLEEELNRLQRHLGLMREAGSPPSETVRRLASSKAGYIEALRTYRRESGSGLKLAKSIVDRVRATQGDA